MYFKMIKISLTFSFNVRATISCKRKSIFVFENLIMPLLFIVLCIISNATSIFKAWNSMQITTHKVICDESIVIITIIIQVLKCWNRTLMIDWLIDCLFSLFHSYRESPFPMNGMPKINISYLLLRGTLFQALELSIIDCLDNSYFT